ncbi:MAG: hypothetical protein OEW95_06615 [Candidatus Bathyarchaeota archaeon]|nr:hypothetical protein [Candidatus Bathyarchaeota archaeon]
MKSPTPLIFVILFLMLSIFNVVVYAVPDVQVTVSTDKQIYGSDEPVHIYGDLKRDGTPVANALIAIQVNDAQNNIVSIRTRSTGTTPSSWSIDITELISCDQTGTPRNTFMKGSLAYFKVTVKNLDTVSERYVTVTINLHDSNQVSFGIAWVGTPVGPDREFTYLTSIPIPSEASTGVAYAFANAYNKWPREKGIAYCGEEAVNFTITDGVSLSSNDGFSSSESTSSEGTYELAFKLRSTPALGDHTVYASYYQTLATTTFDVVWLFTDIDRNGEIDILDIAKAAKAYGSEPGDANWNPKADVTGNGIIDILDIAKVAKDYGKTRT